jgi:glycosyltransferase involved in cell wall biosynthesis
MNSQTRAASTCDLSIVVPVYNSASIFPVLYRQLVDVLEKTVASFEIIAVVDGCPDDSAKVVAGIGEQDSRVCLIELSRNFGEQAAITAGLEYARGDMVVVMDDDMEDPPRIIPEFIAKAREGYDVVYGIMKKRKTVAHRRFFYSSYYRLLNMLTDIKMPRDAGSYSLMTRPVVDQINAMPESNRYVRGMRTWVGFNQIGLEYERDERYEGRSGYNLRKYFRFALDAILSFSYRPLDWLSIIGALISFGSFIFGLSLIIRKWLGLVRDIPGYASIMVVQLFLGGVILLALGVIGQYIARIYDEAKRRPSYVVKRSLGFQHTPHSVNPAETDSARTVQESIRAEDPK